MSKVYGFICTDYADRSTLYPMLDALVATLLDWLGDVPDAELQATLLAKPLVGRVNRLVAKHKNRSWDNFVLTETEVETMVTQILTDSYSLRSMGEVFVVGSTVCFTESLRKFWQKIIWAFPDGRVQFER